MCTYGNGVTLIFQGMGLGVTTKIFEIDGLPNFLKYEAALSLLGCIGALLKIVFVLFLNYAGVSRIHTKSAGLPGISLPGLFWLVFALFQGKSLEYFLHVFLN